MPDQPIWDEIAEIVKDAPRENVMTKIDDGGPAFPVVDLSKTRYSGMSLRAWFAGEAMKGFAHGLHIPSCDERLHTIPGSMSLAEYRAAAATEAVAWADAMLAELRKEVGDA